jgi:hypothetical protein
MATPTPLTNVLQDLDESEEDGEISIEGEIRMFLLVTCRLMTGESAWPDPRNLATKNQLGLTSFHLGTQYSEEITSPDSDSDSNVNDEEGEDSSDLTSNPSREGNRV